MKLDIGNAPELEWLKADSINGTPEGADVIGKEFKRTWCSIELLDDVLNDDYEAFSACQPADTRITRESFNELRDWVCSVLETQEDMYAMRAYLVINDLGKVKDFVEKITSSLGVETVDHDKILYEGLKAHPEYSPTFNSLSTVYQDLILEGLSTNFNMGQYVQCECLPESLSPLYLINSEEALNFYMIHVLFDIAGAAGHVNSNGSLICNDLYWKKFSWALDTIYGLVIKDIYTPLQAYVVYLKHTMDYYGVSNSYVVAKLCNMISVSTKEEAHEIEEANNELDPKVKEVLNKELMATGHCSNTGILLYYAPATFRNALGYYKKINPKTAIKNTVLKIAPVIASIFEQIRDTYSIESGVTTAFIAEVAKAAMNPEQMPSTWKLIKVGDDIRVEC